MRIFLNITFPFAGRHRGGDCETGHQGTSRGGWLGDGLMVVTWKRFHFVFFLQVVQSGGKNLEICVMSEGQKMRMMALPEIEKVVAEVEKEKEEEAAQKKKEKQSEKK